MSSTYLFRNLTYFIFTGMTLTLWSLSPVLAAEEHGHEVHGETAHEAPAKAEEHGHENAAEHGTAAHKTHSEASPETHGESSHESSTTSEETKHDSDHATKDHTHSESHIEEPDKKHSTKDEVDAYHALKRLLEGNKHFMEGKNTNPDQSPERRKEIADTQKPFAVIVTCSDSRVSPEILFDQGLGDLFVIRTAGQVIGEPSLGSIEYAVDHLHANLIIVLGHERCGAVTAALASDKAPGHIQTLVEAIQPAVERTPSDTPNRLEATIKKNVELQVQTLREIGPILSKRVQQKTLKVVGAYYDLDTGEVTLVE